MDYDSLVSRHAAPSSWDWPFPPSPAPYGIAAVETLKNHGLWEQVEKKLVFGESIAQTN
jgi:hypothetical protein